MRSYALGNEAGLVVTTYPDATKRPRVPLSYAFEAWTGAEYTAATGMLYTGMHKQANQIIGDIRDRYDGYKRNPFNEEECGNHYVRAMASWSAIVALSKFNYSGVDKTFSITATPGNYFWSNGYSWGNAVVTGTQVKLTVYYGGLDLRSIRLSNGKVLNLKTSTLLRERNSIELPIR